MLNFFSNDVSVILKDFHKVLDKLETAINYHEAKAKKALEEMVRQDQLNRAHFAEAQRARKVTDNISKLLAQ